MKTFASLLPAFPAARWWQPRRAGFAALITAVLTLAGAGAVRAQSDNFNDADDDDWTRYDPIGTHPAVNTPQNTWSFPDGHYRLQALPTPLPAAGPARVGSLRQDVVYNNFHQTLDLIDWDPARTNAIGLVARVQPSPAFGTFSSYVFGYVTGDNYLAVVKIDRERTRAIAGSLPFPIRLTPGHGYRLTFTGVGNQLTGRLFDLNDLINPLAEVKATDNSYTSGTAGILAFAVNSGVLSPVDGTVDNYTATDRDRPRLKIAWSTVSFMEVLVSWPVYEGEEFVLQRTLNPGAAADWADVTDNITIDGDRYVHNAGTPIPGENFFYRLRKTGSP